MSGEPEIVWFDGDGPLDPPTLGGKCRNLVALTRSALPVPPGFAIPAEMFVAFIDAAGLRAHLKCAVPIGGSSLAAEHAAELRQRLARAEMPSEFRRSIIDAYGKLGARVGVALPRVAVRSSATTEDQEMTSAALAKDILNQYVAKKKRAGTTGQR